MPRNREFCAAEALDKAMHVFWQKGYFATSIEDLVAATGVSRYGLYSEFGDKNGLFLAALQQYESTVAQPLIALFQQPGSPLAALRRIFETLASSAREPAGRLGCLLFNSVNEMRQHDEATAGRILAMRERLAGGIRQLLDHAVALGELPADFDAQREADFLYGVLHALPNLSRSGADPATIDNVVAVALSTLK
jgi:TetR/AcrR family transcriptional repressor of nem operon